MTGFCLCQSVYWLWFVFPGTMSLTSLSLVSFSLYLYIVVESHSKRQPPGTYVWLIPPERRGRCSWKSPLTWRWNCDLPSVPWLADQGLHRMWLQGKQFKTDIIIERQKKSQEVISQNPIKRFPVLIQDQTVMKRDFWPFNCKVSIVLDLFQLTTLKAFSVI